MAQIGNLFSKMATKLIMTAKFAWTDGNKINLEIVTDRIRNSLIKNALVEVRCGVDHSSIWIPGVGNRCRYARGFVEYKKIGIRIQSHQCHLCSGYWLMKANTPQEEQLCSNCKGPVIVMKEQSCWPNMVVLDGFLTGGE